MSAEIQTAIDPAQTVPINLSQTGDRNMHFSNAEQVVVNHHTCPYGAHPFPFFCNRARKNASGPLEVDDEYYNLFVTSREIKNSRVIINKCRVLQSDSEIVRQLSVLDREAQERIKSFPSLIMYENQLYGGQAKPEQEAYFGYVTDIKVQENGIVKIRFQSIATINQQAINDIADILDIFVRKGVMELNTTHWTIKHVNLIEELLEAGLLTDQQVNPHSQEERQWQTIPRNGQASPKYPSTSA